MALAKNQKLLVERLIAMGRLGAEVLVAYIEDPDEVTMDELEAVLQSEHKVTGQMLMFAKAFNRGMQPYVASKHRLGADTFRFLSHDDCLAMNCLPIAWTDDFFSLAVGPAFDPAHMSKIQEGAKRHIILMMSPAKDIAEKLKKKTESTSATEIESSLKTLNADFNIGELSVEVEKDKAEESGPVIDLINTIIEDAYFSGASDIHIDPHEKELVIRFRIDGNLAIKYRLPGKAAGAVIARIKIMCDLNIAEKRMPQDGRIVFKKYTRKNLDVDLRVSTGPLNYGEGVVMRILDKQKSTLPLPQLGFTEENLARYRECVRQPYGMILHCGPTGSGKSMTLYSALNEINTEDVCIRTAEDPIEYTLPGINQMQMNKQIGLTFATALRAFLRQDPDIILVGEIRDKETAGIAIEAALTGHLLVSTLHANDAPSTVARLTDMGVEAFMISSSLVCVCAQRLLRRVCTSCKVSYDADDSEKRVLEKAIGWSGQIFKAKPGGCGKCGGSGYKGRVGIHELMTNSEELTAAINHESDTAALKKIAMKDGMKTLHQDSLIKVKMGLTTMAEALSTVPADM